MRHGRPDLTGDCGCERDRHSGEILYCHPCYALELEDPSASNILAEKPVAIPWSRFGADAPDTTAGLGGRRSTKPPVAL